jgi:hypothetical protein
MSDPVVTKPDSPLNPLQVDPTGTGEHPTAMMYSNGGILFLGLAALFFCLQAMEGLFVLSIVLILLLALFNLWTLAKWRKWWPQDRAATTRQGTAGSTGSYPST